MENKRCELKVKSEPIIQRDIYGFESCSFDAYVSCLQEDRTVAGIGVIQGIKEIFIGAKVNADIVIKENGDIELVKIISIQKTE